MKFFSRIFILSLFSLILLFSSPLQAGILISEFVTSTDDDWVELTLDGTQESMEISGLFVTMYYGRSEPLAEAPVTLYSRNLPDTPWDDRYVVVHLKNPSGTDETDSAGDVNGNCIRDIYCDNYNQSLWNSDGIVSIDEDSDPKNGMLDCAAYSNCDGSMNSSIEKSVRAAFEAGQWIIDSENVQLSCIDIGPDGLTSVMSVCRRGCDTNTLSDFYISRFQTPGADNMETSPVSEEAIISVPENRIFVKRDSFTEQADVRIFAAQTCNVRLRVFTVTGRMLYESPLYRNMAPGYSYLSWKGPSFSRKLKGGMYIGTVEATGTEIRGSVTRRFFFVLGGVK